MLTQIVILSLVGGLLCLDRIFLQAMLSRPIVIAPVAGFLLGDSYTGLIIGAIFELFWIDRAPIGIYIPPNDSVASAFAAALAILAGQSLGAVTKELMALSVLLAVPFGILAKRMDVRMMAANDRLSDRALEEWAREKDRLIEEGDHPIIIMPPSDYTPVPTATPKPETIVLTRLEIWKELIFGGENLP